jgi:hypothetical protein
MGTQAKRSTHTDIQPLLINRMDAARLLGNVHISKLTRLEHDGLLIPRRLNPRVPNSHCFYSVANVEAIANGTIEEWLTEHAPQPLVREKKPKLKRKRLRGRS